MLWNAGQKRVTRDERGRLAELFVAFRDAGLEVLVKSGQAKPKGTWRLPPYIQSSAPVRPPTADRDAMLRELGALFPGAIRRSES